jgi:hypothetical protein
MANLLEKTGKIVFLRAHDVGTKFGPPNDQLDVEAVFILNAINEGAFGFQLRNDGNLPARQAMFSLLRDAFVNNLPVTADFLIDPGKKNGVAIRIALTRQTSSTLPAVSSPESFGGQVLPGSGTSTT